MRDNGDSFLGFDDNLLMTEEKTEAEAQRYIWGNELLALEGKESFFYLQDHLHSPVRLVDGSGMCEDEAFAYDEFGVPVVDAKPGEGEKGEGRMNPFGLTGYQMDDMTGLYYAQARYYDPMKGRMASEDPVQNGENWYGYCGNNPLKWIDPSGLVCEEGQEGTQIAIGLLSDEERSMLAINPGPNGLELMSRERIQFLFGKNIYDVVVTDLITGKSFPMVNWDPNPGYHSDPRFPGDDDGASQAIARSILNSSFDEEYWKKPESWSRDARPVAVTVTDRFGIERDIAAGFVLYPHHTVYSSFGQGGEMCTFYGFNTRGYARDHGNEAAMNAYNGINSIVEERKPGSKR